MDFKSCSKCWQVIHNGYKAFRGCSKTFLSIGGEFEVNVPFKTAPEKMEEN